MSNAPNPRHSLHPSQGGWKALAPSRSVVSLFRPDFGVSGAGLEALYLDTALYELGLREPDPRCLEWHAHLEGMTEPLGSLARELWRLLQEVVGEPRVPQAGPVSGGGFQFVWDRDEHHLEIEILADRTLEWFYRNRRTGNLEGGECALDLPDRARQLLQLL